MPTESFGINPGEDVWELLLAAFVAAAVADIGQLAGYPYSSYDVGQNSVIGGGNAFFGQGVSSTTPSSIFNLPISEHQDFNAQISNVGVAGYSTPGQSFGLGSGFGFTTPAPNVDINPVSYSTAGLVQSTPSPLGYNLGLNQYSTAGLVQSTPSPLSYNLGLNQYSTVAPNLNFGNGELTSVDSTQFGQDAVINSFQGGSAGSLEDAFGASQTQVAKHLYFYAAPEEPEVRTRINIARAEPAKKNVKVIFIKAPAPPPVAPVEIAAPPQNEEKTLVYVLVKKPEDQQDIIVRTPPTTEAPKPEVFFIKYKTQQEAEEAISKVQEGQVHSEAHVSANNIAGGEFVNSINRENSFRSQPIINYVKSSQAQESYPINSGLVYSNSLPSLRLNQGLRYTTASPIFNAGFGYTTPAPSFSPFSFSTPVPNLNSGFLYSTPSPNLGFNSGYGFVSNGVGLEPRSEVVDAGNNFQGSSDISSSTISPEISSSSESGIHDTSSAEPFSTYGLPNSKK